MAIEKVAVVGAGVMGAGIAAHIANAGHDVVLLDIVPDHAKDRSVIARAAVEKLLKAEPPALMYKDYAKRIIPGNIEDDLHRLADVDWIVEAIIEKPDIKQSLYRKLDAVCRPDCLISSNTSTLPLQLLTGGMPDSFKRRFMITHFFNPPRYMRLLEIVAGSDVMPELLTSVEYFADVRLGKNVVLCRDTPGFIGNRIGIFWLLCGLHEAIDLGLSVEQADAAMAIPFGIPKTGIFGLLDLVGLDLIPPILSSMTQALPASDAFYQFSALPAIVRTMIDQGHTGRKGKGGFYRLSKVEGVNVKESINLGSGDYSLSIKADAKSLQLSVKGGYQEFFDNTDLSVFYAWRVMARTLAYAASLVPEIADDPDTIDTAMRDGFNWQFGPFELIDRIGNAWLADQLQADSLLIPPLLALRQPMYRSNNGRLETLRFNNAYQPVKRRIGVVLLADIKRLHAPVLHNRSASLWDVGDGVACLEFHSKMNTLDLDVMELIRQSIDTVNSSFKALVIHNEGENFSAGANLGLLMTAIQEGNWNGVEALIKTGQQTYQALKYAPFPVVGAPTGLALGGGCEILLHCDAIQAHAELYVGLVEVGVGLIPGWGGCKEYLRRCMALPKRPGGPIPAMVKAFQTISLATVSKSAVDAKELLFLSREDGITMNKYRLLADAKTKALALAKHYASPKPVEYRLSGRSGKILLNMGVKAFRLLGKATEYDVVVADHLAGVLSGGAADLTDVLSEEDLLQLECEAFVDLVKEAGTQARLDHMLKTGKPLRN